MSLAPVFLLVLLPTKRKDNKGSQHCLCLHAGSDRAFYSHISKLNQSTFISNSDKSTLLIFLKLKDFFFPQTLPESTTDVTVPPVLTPPREAGCRTDSIQPALHPPGITASAGPPPDTPLSSSTSSSPTALPSLSRSDPGTGGGLQSRSNSSERLLEASSGTSEDYHDADGTRRARAIENQYSFY